MTYASIPRAPMSGVLQLQISMGKLLLCFILFQCVGSGAFASQDPTEGPPKSVAPALLPYGMIDGYTDDASKEMPDGPHEMILMEKPDFLNKPELNQVLFNKQLSSEFIVRYQQQFGYTEQEENYFLTNRQGYYMSPTGLTATQQDDQRRQFAQYMVERLAEWHTDNVMKNDPQFKQVYELKQKVSNYKIDVGPQSKLDMTYSFVGNYANVVYENPKFGTFKGTVNMNPGSFTPGAPTEMLALWTHPVTYTIRFETSYAFMAQSYRTMLEKRLTANMATNITETVFFGTNDVGGIGGELTLLGFNWTF